MITTTTKLTQEQANTIIKLIYALGGKFASWPTVQDALEKHKHTEYPHLRIYQNCVFDFTAISPCSSVSFEQAVALILESFFPSPVIVQLSKNYSATREGDQIVVGCQKFPVEKVKEVYEKLCQS